MAQIAAVGTTGRQVQIMHGHMSFTRILAASNNKCPNSHQIVHAHLIPEHMERTCLAPAQATVMLQDSPNIHALHTQRVSPTCPKEHHCEPHVHRRSELLSARNVTLLSLSRTDKYHEDSHLLTLQKGSWSRCRDSTSFEFLCSKQESEPEILFEQGLLVRLSTTLQ